MFQLLARHEGGNEERQEPVERYLLRHAAHVEHIGVAYTDDGVTTHEAVLLALTRTHLVVARVKTMSRALAIARLPKLADAERVEYIKGGYGASKPIS